MTYDVGNPGLDSAGEERTTFGALRFALSVCAAQFRRYERDHLAKTPPDDAKAIRNADMALFAESALGQKVGLAGIYVVSRASILARGAMWREARELGAQIISSWIDEDGENDTADLSELWTRIRREVLSARKVVMYVETDDFPLKGAFVEIGMALAGGIPITIVAKGVAINGRNCRPFGSWIRHPSVTFSDSLAEALDMVP